MGNLGRLAQSLRLARRRRVSDLGLPPRYRLLGLAVMPLAAALLVVARAGGGTGIGTRSHYSNLFLVLHVGLVLVAFAGLHARGGAVCALSLAGAAAEAPRDDDPARPAPSLATLDRLAARTVRFSLPPLTLGIAVGDRAARPAWRRVDAVVVATLRHLGACGSLSRAPPRRLVAAVARRTSRSRASCSSSSSGSPSP